MNLGEAYTVRIKKHINILYYCIKCKKNNIHTTYKYIELQCIHLVRFNIYYQEKVKIISMILYDCLWYLLNIVRY